jgi:hypothetical protein
MVVLVTSKYVQIIAATNLSNPLSWYNFGSPVIAVSSDTSVTSPIAGPMKFFRVFSE